MKNYGLILPEKIETREEGAEHVLGASTVPGKVINSDGDWMLYLPDREPQSKNGVETYACTVFNTLSAIETVIYKATGVKVNYADRYVANVAKNRGILDPYVGADPHKILEMIRTISGNIIEGRCAWTDDVTTTDKYYNIVGQELANLMTEGAEWYKEWRINHYWLWTGNPTPQQKRALIKDALTKGTVCASVYAWVQQGDIYIKPDGVGENHWTMIARAEGDLPYKNFDSYDNFVKDLDPLYNFGLAKVIIVTRPVHVFTKNLGFLTEDDEVEHLQRALLSLNYAIPHATTRFYGNETRDAIALFQKANGILGDEGINFGPRTRYALNRTLNPSTDFIGAASLFFQSYSEGFPHSIFSAV